MGLVTGACLAHVGHRVTCVDKDEERVAELTEGRMPIYEPGLEEMVVGEVGQGRLSFSTDLAGTIHEADVVFIAVDTPQGDDGSADLSSVGAVARMVGGGAGPAGGQEQEAAAFGRGKQEHRAGRIGGLRLDAHRGGRRGGRGCPQ